MRAEVAAAMTGSAPSCSTNGEITMPPPMPSSPGHAWSVSASIANLGGWRPGTQLPLCQHAGWSS